MIKKQLETDIVRQICDWLFVHKYFFWRQNNTPIFDRKFGGFRAMPKYTPKGLPDVLIVYKGNLIGIEVKIPGYWKYTDAQKAMGEKFIINGAHYHLVTSLNETVDIMRIYNDTSEDIIKLS